MISIHGLMKKPGTGNWLRKRDGKRNRTGNESVHWRQKKDGNRDNRRNGQGKSRRLVQGQA
jgi:hypothetical protein